MQNKPLSFSVDIRLNQRRNLLNFDYSIVLTVFLLGLFGLAMIYSASGSFTLVLRQAMYLQRLRYGASKITHQKAYNWATKGSAALLGRSDIGEIAVGKQADLALFKLDEMRFSGSHDSLAALLLCGAQKADRVMIAGNWKVVDGQIVGQDASELTSRHSNAAKLLRQLSRV